MRCPADFVGHLAWTLRAVPRPQQRTDQSRISRYTQKHGVSQRPTKTSIPSVFPFQLSTIFVSLLITRSIYIENRSSGPYEVLNSPWGYCGGSSVEPTRGLSLDWNQVAAIPGPRSGRALSPVEWDIVEDGVDGEGSALLFQKFERSALDKLFPRPFGALIESGNRR